MKIPWNLKQIFKNSGIILFIVFLYFLISRWALHLHGWVQLIIFAFLLFALLVFFKKYLWKLDNFISGDRGELAVGDVLLHSLPKNYIHLSNVNLENRGNIDYVLIGPTGVWTIEVKSHVGYIDFNGTELRRKGKPFEKDFLKQAWAEAISVRNLLKQKLKIDYSIKPVIVFSDSNAKMKFGFNEIEGVYVINLSWLSKLVLGGEYILKPKDIEMIAEIIEKSSIKY